MSFFRLMAKNKVLNREGQKELSQKHQQAELERKATEAEQATEGGRASTFERKYEKDYGARGGKGQN